MRDRDNTTRTGAKDPWGREAGPLAQRPEEARTSLDSEPGKRCVAESGEGQRKLHRGAGTRGARLTAQRCRKALSDRLALKPYWGKPAVRNFRGDDGNVGIIRSPVRAIVLLDRREAWALEYAPVGKEGLRPGRPARSRRAQPVALDESVRTLLIERYVEQHEPLADRTQNNLHAIAHLVAEDQLAAGKPAQTAEALKRLLAQGLSRHEALIVLAQSVWASSKRSFRPNRPSPWTRRCCTVNSTP